jgi:hypothetical protein
VAYRHEYMGSVSYSYPWRDYVVGGELPTARLPLYGIKVARLRVLPTDVRGGTRPDSFYDVNRVSLTLSYEF